MATTRRAAPARNAQTGRPIMALLDLLGRRWALRILWELRDAPLSFRELRERCDDMSPTVLNQRLHDLREADIVVLQEEGGYTLSRSGWQLLETMQPLQRWSMYWQKRMAAKEKKSGR